jgi:Domain of unknown function (DUF4190)
MKYCPQCNRQYTETWTTFCSDDGTMLIEELSPPVDPNWNPVVREPTYKPPPSEEQTQWLPREPPETPAWVAPDERPPMRPPLRTPPMWDTPRPAAPVWQPPPPPPRPAKQSQGLALASMLTGLLGLVLGCLGPLPGVAAVVLGWMALSQIKKTPETTGGKPMAIIGIVSGGLTIVFYGLFLLWMIFAGLFGSF